MATKITVNTLLSAFVFGFAAVYLYPILSLPIGVFDEGVVLTGADRIQKGYLPFDDFYTPYPPGQYYVVAWLFDIFGSSATVGRIYDLFVKSVLTVAIFLFIEKASHSRLAALTGCVMSLVFIAATSLPLYPVYFALLLIILALYCYIRHLASSNYLWVVFSAFLVVVCSVFRHDFALYCGTSLLLAMLIEIIGNRTIMRATTRVFVGSGFGFALILLLYVLGTFDIREVISQLILLPAEYMESYRGLPYPGLSIQNSWFYIVPLTLFFGLITSLASIFLHKKNSPYTQAVLVVSLCGVLFLNQVRVRSDIWHLLPAAVFSIVLVCVWWAKAKTVRKWSFGKVSCTGVFLAYVIMIVPIVDWKIRSVSRNYFEIDVYEDLARAGSSRMTPELAKVVSYLSESTETGDPIYVGVENHDQFIVNHVIVYYLSNRNYATKYHHLDPGYTNNIAAQQEIVTDLKTTLPEKLVLTESYWYEENASKNDLRLNVVDNYIQNNYALDKTFGDYEIWGRK